MAIVNKPNTFSGNTTISSSEINSNFDTLYNEFNGSISAANLADDAVTAAKLADNAVVTANITDAAVTPAKLLAGTGTSWAWQSWTPNFTNFTTTSATITGRYAQIGKTVIAEFYILCGASTAFGNTACVTPPVAQASIYTTGNKIPAGSLIMHDFGTQVYFGNMYWDAISVSGKVIWNMPNVSGTYPSRTNTTATTPFTIANGDEISGQIIYEAA